MSGVERENKEEIIGQNDDAKRRISFVSLKKNIDQVVIFIARKISRKKGSFFEKVYFWLLSKRYAICQNKIVFMTFQGTYTCNPKYICEALLANRSNLDLVWIVNNEVVEEPDKYGIPGEVRLVSRTSLARFRELASAKVWVDNALNCCWRELPKKKGQYYINTWHGSLGIKRLDTYNPNKGYWISRAVASNGLIDYMLSNSDFDDDVFSEAYWPDVQKVRLGHPRNDLFFDENKMQFMHEKVIAYFELPQDIKIAIYAPTFRDDDSIDFLNLDFVMLRGALSKRFGGMWCVLLRLHSKNAELAGSIAEHDEYIRNAGDYPDMQELMAAADIGISDYSSWMFDFMLTGRPCFIYAPDLERYNDLRGFYYPIETTPFPIAKDNETMSENVLAFNEKNYAVRLGEFLDKKGCMEDGHASKRTGELILKIIDKE